MPFVNKFSWFCVYYFPKKGAEVYRIALFGRNAQLIAQLFLCHSWINFWFCVYYFSKKVVMKMCCFVNCRCDSRIAFQKRCTALCQAGLVFLSAWHSAVPRDRWRAMKCAIIFLCYSWINFLIFPKKGAMKRAEVSRDYDDVLRNARFGRNAQLTAQLISWYYRFLATVYQNLWYTISSPEVRFCWYSKRCSFHVFWKLDLKCCQVTWLWSCAL